MTREGFLSFIKEHRGRHVDCRIFRQSPYLWFHFQGVMESAGLHSGMILWVNVLKLGTEGVRRLPPDTCITWSIVFSFHDEYGANPPEGELVIDLMDHGDTSGLDRTRLNSLKFYADLKDIELKLLDDLVAEELMDETEISQ